MTTKALIIGYGKMGKLIAQFAPEYNIEVTAVVGRSLVDLPKQIQGFHTLDEQAISSCDVAFDFAESHHITSRIELLAKAKKPLIIGTTGWDEQHPIAKEMVAKYESCLLYAPNFSLGVALFLRLVNQASSLFAHFSAYDVGMLELHHRKKQDAPSGTAKAMAKEVLKHYPHKKVVHNAPESSPIGADCLQLAALRVGSVPGTHELFFDSPEDSVTISHTARSREGFARGALLSAAWLQAKMGWFTLDDLISDTLKGKAE